MMFLLQRANYFGSITQASTVCLGPGSNGEDVFVPMHEMLPMVHPNDLIIDGNLHILYIDIV